MKSYCDWKLEEIYSYNPSIDGPPLQPTTIHGAETQIRALALHIRTTLMRNPELEKHREQILKATELLDQGANMIGDNMTGDERWVGR